MPGASLLKPDNLLHELEELWIDLARHGPEKQSSPDAAGILRACAMTLIVFVDDEDDPMALGETLALLMRNHPSRAIAVRLAEGRNVLRSRVFAQCWMPFGQRRQICCEQIELTASLDRILDLPSIILPLAAPDLPRVSWFRTARISGAADISGLLSLGDRIIVDSAHRGAPAFADLRTLVIAGIRVGDLSWTRITPLRQLIAQLIDGHDLSSFHEAQIEYCGQDSGPEAKYLQAWLRAVLPGVPVALRRYKDGDGHGEIRSVRIEPDIQISIDNRCAEYAARSLHQRASLPKRSDDELLAEELKIMKHDPVFEHALQRMTIWNPRS